jgi:hypothetical protein
VRSMLRRCRNCGTACLRMLLAHSVRRPHQLWVSMRAQRIRHILWALIRLKVSSKHV